MYKIMRKLIYVYAIFIVFLCLAGILSLLTLGSDIKSLLNGNSIYNVPLIAAFEIGIFAGISMILPALRKIYSDFQWAYSFIRILFFDLIILGTSIQVFSMNLGSNVIKVIVSIFVFIIMRAVMCFYLNRKDGDKKYKLTGTIMLVIGLIALMYFDGYTSNAPTDEYSTISSYEQYYERGIELC